jgi:hypothetical protein
MLLNVFFFDFSEVVDSLLDSVEEITTFWPPSRNHLLSPGGKLTEVKKKLFFHRIQNFPAASPLPPRPRQRWARRERPQPATDR